MVAPFILLMMSLTGVMVALVLPGLSDLGMLAGLCAVASLFLLVQAWLRGAKAKPKWVVIDGSNVMHWKDNAPDIDTLREVLRTLRDQGFTPGVVFDANAGYKLTGGYKHNRALGRLLGLPEDRVVVVPKGTPADPRILAAARDMGARVVSNDRFRDWETDFPEVKTAGHLIPGGYRDGAVWLDLGAAG